MKQSQRRQRGFIVCFHIQNKLNVILRQDRCIMLVASWEKKFSRVHCKQTSLDFLVTLL